MDDQQRRLLASVAQWFAAPDQVAHYTSEAPQGPTPVEIWLLGHLPGQGRILDLGCGAGRLSWPLAERGFAVLGADISLPLLCAARAYRPALPTPPAFAQVDPLALPVRAATFDAIVACKVYGYLPGRATRQRLLTTLSRLLRPGGRLLLSRNVVPRYFRSYRDDQHLRAAASFRRLEPGDTFSTAEGTGYVHWFTPARLRQELTSAPLILIAWQDDHDLGGQGYLQLAVLERLAAGARAEAGRPERQ